MSKKRIDWIDYAKGIAIILVIVGHSLEFCDFIKVFIYSFHMPLFFILSGYNLKNVNNIKEFFCMMYKDFKKLVIPYIFAVIFCCIVKYWDYGLLYILKTIFYSVIWGNGVGGNTFNNLFGVIPVSGPFWFLICLFLSRNIIRLIDFLFVKKFSVWLYVLLFFIGMLIGFYSWLPFSFDIVLVSLVFLKLGQYYKKKELYFRKFDKYIFIIFLLIWLICMLNGFYLNLAIRHYSAFIVSVVESICGSFCVIYLCKWLEKFKLGFLSYIGKCSLIILIVHSLECLLIDYSNLISNIGVWLFIFLKTFVVVVISVLFSIFINKFKKFKYKLLLSNSLHLL